MTLISSTINRNVLSLHDCCIVGSIENVYYDANCKNIAYFGISRKITADNAAENARISVAFEDVCAFSDALVLSDTAALCNPTELDFSACLTSLQNMPVYTLNGEAKGAISDISFNSRGKIDKILLTDGSFHTPRNFFGFGDVALLKTSRQAKTAPRNRIPRPKAEKLVTILADVGVLADEAEKVQSILADVGVLADEAEKVQSILADVGVLADEAEKVQSILADVSVLADEAKKAQSIEPSKVEPTTLLTQKLVFAPLPTEKPTPKQAEKPIAPLAEKIIIHRAEKRIDPPTEEPIFVDDILSGAEVNSADDVNDETPANGETLFNAENLSTCETQANEGKANNACAHVPPRIICDYSFLLGRHLVCDLLTYLDEPLASAGAVVTETLVEQVRKCGKLIDLTLNSK